MLQVISITKIQDYPQDQRVLSKRICHANILEMGNKIPIKSLEAAILMQQLFHEEVQFSMMISPQIPPVVSQMMRKSLIKEQLPTTTMVISRVLRN